jgi:FtsZ-interacting cell division protein ZipA
MDALTDAPISPHDNAPPRFFPRDCHVISEFQLALIAIAAFVIAAILAYNYWQEQRYRERTERAFKTDHPDVLLDAGDVSRPVRLEPQLGELPLPEDDQVMDAPEDTFALAPRSASAGVNTAIDTVALILAEAPVTASALTPFIERARHIARPVIWEGLVGGLWEPLLTVDLTSGQVKELRVGLQLANRSGPTHREKIEEFMRLVEECAGAVSAVSQREQPVEAHERAQSIDAFCADTDIEIAVNVVGMNGVTFAPTKVRGLAEAAGMVHLDSGEYAQCDDTGEILFTLRNMNPAEPAGVSRSTGYLSGITLALDVPHVTKGKSAVDRMYSTALHMADALGGEVVDDNRAPLHAGGVEAIKKAVGGIATRMEHFGVAPGSPAAKRLFS